MLTLDVDSNSAVVVAADSGAIGDLVNNGVVLLTKGSAAAMTLRAPVAGSPDAGGEDGRRLRVMAGSAYAHVITTPASKVNGANNTITLSGAVGDSVDLIAYNGVWYTSNPDNFAASTV